MSRKSYPKTNNDRMLFFQQERLRLLKQLDEITDMPFNFLSIVWLGLVVYDYVYGFNHFFEFLFYLIWVFFAVHFLVEFTLSPSRKDYLKSHILTIVSLFIPTVRVLRFFNSFRILRAARAIRSANLVQIVTSLNRGMKTLRSVLQGRGVGYLASLTLLVIFLGAAAIFYFENPKALEENGYKLPSEAKIEGYSDALWFTAMLIVTTGSGYWPVSAEGRILTFAIALYAFAIFGYITATIASFIIGKDYRNKK